jgi:predicted NodU family carbamoyl transferase
MLILGIHTGNHDSAACLFDEYDVLAAVPQERLTRLKGMAAEFQSRPSTNVSQSPDAHAGTSTWSHSDGAFFRSAIFATRLSAA